MGHISKKEAVNKAAKFQNGFKSLTEQLGASIAKETLVVALRNEEKFDKLKRIMTKTVGRFMD